MKQRTRRTGPRSTVPVLFLLGLLAACGGGGKAAVSTVDDLARGVQGVDDTTRLRSALEAANGGSATVDGQVVDQFQSRPGALSRIMAKADPDVGVACDAYEAGSTVITADPLVDAAEAQQILNELHQDVSTGQVANQAILFGCKVQTALSEY